MLDVAVIVLKLVVVQQVKEIANDGVVLVLNTGQQPVLRATLKDYDYFLRLIQRAHERNRPIGMAIANNEVERVVLANQDTVADILEDGPTRVTVRFLGHDGTYRLDRSHPEAVRIFKTLVGSRQNQSQVWFAAKLPELLLQDAATNVQLGLK